MTFSSMVAPEVVNLATYNAASDENFIKIKTFLSQSRSTILGFVNAMREHKIRLYVPAQHNTILLHDINKWNISRVTGPLWGESTGNWWIPHKGQWHGALMFSLICAWTNGWANNRDSGELRRHCAHYDVTVMVNGLTFVFSTKVRLLLSRRYTFNFQNSICPNRCGRGKKRFNIVLILCICT